MQLCVLSGSGQPREPLHRSDMSICKLPWDPPLVSQRNTNRPSDRLAHSLMTGNEGPQSCSASLSCPRRTPSNPDRLNRVLPTCGAERCPRSAPFSYRNGTPRHYTAHRVSAELHLNNALKQAAIDRHARLARPQRVRASAKSGSEGLRLACRNSRGRVDRVTATASPTKRRPCST